MKKHALGFACLFTLLAYSIVIVYIHDHSDNILAWQMITYCSILGPFLGIIAIFWLLQLRREYKQLKRMYETDRNTVAGYITGSSELWNQQRTKPPTT